MKLRGEVHKFGADVDTDAIIPARYLNTSDPKHLALHCMEDADPDFPKKVKTGDVIVADKNFGCGSSREHAPLAIQAAGVSCVIAKSFARIFYRNAINIGLPILECPEVVDEVRPGDELEVDLDRGVITNLTSGKEYQATPFPEFMQRIMASGGLINYVRERMKAGV
ncbi:3-isopropylmalate dehydratase small subunit [Syntrophothermus lipocalidus]|uniref:3-isopropylmalate dehydratase small subunit n=1 Tax=Syntrophothermus lipocalidus (strain DSM 12680 / TGB-C1) TaxID=643648 RepID=D7CJ21_SYNLT|nr:3-isopropylmalate dehydratase small subunit [Syntrophothermus lipocalidus]ADI02899.1 3-isopropylmalate dehydratase, small subunit [Syntrophothermus lipocalidus DSM 12680]HOV43932.1 3-isopropylmalate dehydratase small subunit [Syntrophothermus lipocalidus]